MRADIQERINDELTFRNIVKTVKAKIAWLRIKAKGRKFIGVFKHGGIGDVLQQAAFARAVRRRWPDAYIVMLCRELGPDADGQPLVNNLLRGNDAIGHTITYPAQPWDRCLRAFYDQFDLFFEVQYCAVCYGTNDPLAHHQAHVRLAPFANFAAGFPHSNHWLEELRMTQWELLAQTSGLDVSEDDLWIEVGELPRPLARSKRPIIAVHNMAGGAALAKCAPLTTMIDLAARLKKARYRVVQLGALNDPAIRTAEDFRGLTINQTAAVIKRAALLVDIEGGLGYIARAVGTRRACLFGPTPPSLFKLQGDLILSTFACRPCWWHADRWAVNCRERHPICRNIPIDGARIADLVLAEIEKPEPQSVAVIAGAEPKTRRAKR